MVEWLFCHRSGSSESCSYRVGPVAATSLISSLGFGNAIFSCTMKFVVVRPSKLCLKVIGPAVRGSPNLLQYFLRKNLEVRSHICRQHRLVPMPDSRIRVQVKQHLTTGIGSCSKGPAFPLLWLFSHWKNELISFEVSLSCWSSSFMIASLMCRSSPYLRILVAKSGSGAGFGARTFKHTGDAGLHSHSSSIPLGQVA